MELYLKYRPRKLDEVVGQGSAVAQLRAIISDKRIPHAMLFTGPSGTGKTTMARIVKDEIGCHTMDFHEVDCGDVKGVDSVRDIKLAARMPSLHGTSKVWVVDECHKMTNDAQHCFLKTLEDAPRHVYFFLCTTDPHKILKTIRTRCTEINLSRLSDEDIDDLLAYVRKQEKISIDDEVVGEIVYVSDGCARKALVLLDQVRGLKNPDEQIKAVRKGFVNDEEVKKLAQLLIDGKSTWPAIVATLKAMDGSESETLRYQILGYAKACLFSNNTRIWQRAFMLLEVFDKNTFDSKHFGIARMCFEAWQSKA